jgi:hypothetical protein
MESIQDCYSLTGNDQVEPPPAVCNLPAAMPPTTKWFTAFGDEITGVTFHSIDEKKGTAKYDVPWPCSRCGGAGSSERWLHTGLVCFECGGHGHQSRTREGSAYTWERYLKLYADRKARIEKLNAKRKAEADKRSEARRLRNLEDKTAFDQAHPGFTERLQSYMEGNDFLTDLYRKLVDEFGYLSEAQVEAAEKAFARVDAKRATRWVNGNVGNRVTLTLTVDRVLIPEEPSYGQFPSRWTYLCHDSDGNVVVYRGRSEAMPDNGNTGTVVATIKDFGEFRGVKQTIIERPKPAK